MVWRTPVAIQVPWNGYDLETAVPGVGEDREWLQAVINAKRTAIGTRGFHECDVRRELPIGWRKETPAERCEANAFLSLRLHPNMRA